MNNTIKHLDHKLTSDELSNCNKGTRLVNLNTNSVFLFEFHKRCEQQDEYHLRSAKSGKVDGWTKNELLFSHALAK